MGGKETAVSVEQGNPGFFRLSVAYGRGYFSFSCRRLDIITTKRHEMQQTASMIPDTSSPVIKYEQRATMERPYPPAGRNTADSADRPRKKRTLSGSAEAGA